jgi:hypothetical protein
LAPFVDALTPDRILQLADLFMTNTRAQGELDDQKPKRQAKALLAQLKAKLTLATHIDQIDRIVAHVDTL